ncbi:MAG: ribonuclease HII [Flavobacteriia bacterium]|nr:ribonuclease HII [Flavobacteriia bacterium]
MALEGNIVKGRLEAGCDEVGRGCLAGPVVAAAVILPDNVDLPHLNDSKKLNEKRRDELRGLIMDQAIAWAIGSCSHEEIDEMNILKASFEAMHRAIHKLKEAPEFLLIDGNKFTPYGETPHECVIKGDGKFLSIAAASILAKTERDKIMREAHEKWPHYRWDKNVGYPTVEHRAGIAKHGPSPIHRKSFQLLPRQLKLEL